MKTWFLPLASALILLTFSSCLKDDVDEVVKQYSDKDYAVLTASLKLPEQAHQYTVQLPSSLGGFPVSVNNDQATLGRVLFYDTRLSSNNLVSCATCHKADKGFADDVAGSLGVTTERTPRNSLALGSFASFDGFYGSTGSSLFWDNRVGTVAEQSEQTMQNPVEMGNTDLHLVAQRLLEEEYYQILFKKAFPNEFGLSTKQKMLLALEAFVKSIACFDSKFDRELIKNVNPELEFTGFTAQENMGKQLFNTNCVSCHSLSINFSSPVSAANNGLDLDYADKGVGAITFNSYDEGLFKVPMLRNIAVTGPYMHDGRFKTLEEVVEHYSTGVKSHQNLHELLRGPDGQARQLNLNQEEKAALVAFLRTLTDSNSLLHERFSNPFK